MTPLLGLLAGFAGFIAIFALFLIAAAEAWEGVRRDRGERTPALAPVININQHRARQIRDELYGNRERVTPLGRYLPDDPT